ncbi:hypothetical protein KDA_50010 [Dictyobacter alpinus]|uniref:Uncharacterized protein n=1 Tax=Dictyobacter alpinus TaxID=2014873 RepID=A0A402BE33_9CHLR|nr:hypothetical protein [Dictyobacter alpinus]GCE29517.1 hypothetical protein KDA_50010 [Dictyobacter alpinus]
MKKIEALAPLALPEELEITEIEMSDESFIWKQRMLFTHRNSSQNRPQ